LCQVLFGFSVVIFLCFASVCPAARFFRLSSG